MGDQDIGKLEKQWAVIRGAPIYFVTALGAAIVVIWFLVNWADKAVIDGKTQAIETLNIQLKAYKDKLDGATPDEAKQKIAALEARVKGIEPRRLSTTQRDKISSIIKTLPPGDHYLNIESDMQCSDCYYFGNDFQSLFPQPPWIVKSIGIQVPSERSITGLAVLTDDPNNPSPEAAIIAKALKAIDIPFEMMKLGTWRLASFGSRNGANTNASILITAKAPPP